MTAQNISNSGIARRVITIATQLCRLLDPANDRLQLDILVKVAPRPHDKATQPSTMLGL